MDLLALFAKTEDTKRFTAGSWLFHEGTPGDVMYVLLEGEVDVSVRGETVTLAGPGDILGEMALIDSKARSASANAKTDCRVAVVDESRFLSMVQQTPEFSLHVMRVLAHRLRNMVWLI